ncbi:hypothetical protein ABLT32_02145 [Bacteroides pyogenes]|uniref:hypothetical protein n=1 Tax=Bacteroides pyogenes TaxID=310300 RepID=UPI00242FE0EF|nr:hypothetical protein [Bacteroides pyogenes]
MKRTIYVIKGGGQRVRENSQRNYRTEYLEIYESSWCEQTKVAGQNSFTGCMWSTDLEDIQRWSNEWAGKEVDLFKREIDDEEMSEYQ